MFNLSYNLWTPVTHVTGHSGWKPRTGSQLSSRSAMTKGGRGILSSSRSIKNHSGRLGSRRPLFAAPPRPKKRTRQ
ncbi:hypothetical protein I7I53_11481 [Histoplasma capsulatum var. duboisii H88]|uniref:Uncharacterized protein n=1 Tax=Ajellomyces capsulatus (strain H88) TaxID=544711 RepID=A0A8A1L8G6_AJEC8|nr:hypothetical protein I7I53_11481 [Histoplasma capsulatum var. duboisii H88]